MKDLFEGAQYIMDRLEEAGFQAYMVGGCIRDLLLDREMGDIDIATSALPVEVSSLFPKTIPVGIEHGTVIVRHGAVSYEVTTFRKEGKYVDRRHPSSVEYIDSLEEDLSRRDFTINAMAMDRFGTIHDPFGGRQDLQNQLIKTVGNPVERFLEDPLRIMRALRFWSVMGFSLESQTKRACVSLSKELREIAVERIAVEFTKLLRGMDAPICLAFIFEEGFSSSLPDLERYKDRTDHLSSFGWTGLEKDVERWAALLFLLGVSDLTGFLKAWKRSNAFIREVGLLFRFLDKDVRQPVYLYELGEERAVSCLRIRNLLQGKEANEELSDLKKSYHKLPIHSRKQLAVNGRDVVKSFEREKGPWIQEILGEIEKGVIEKTVQNNKEEILSWVRSWKVK
ncbi:tRNA nucleotidyltransferase (CCA-adding enzyme) [Fictibacillus solisalsi]|uniref:CCA-adding enzyme n=1 Tax=Fictibacillus solisalsi TaxID=459525 RepID=A0A1G9VYG7_9BACL|nr:CCA tRNA nucleotidyltransferase [Fictibacillus solisalsi]SDM76805.1 tRNA nucleotidyltransferase (CCA-adding enzyme) [Fictibacillus solisalsi]